MNRHCGLLFLISISICLLSSDGHAQDPPEMGGDYRPGYEAFRVDNWISDGDVSASGDLSLSIPLLVVPGRHGHDFPIILTYNSNVTQRQYASWVGLGWNLDLGSVERTVNGRTDEQGPGLFGTYKLGDEDPSVPDRAELPGRLSPYHPALEEENNALNWNLQDQADLYRVSIDGGGFEMLPFPPDPYLDDSLSMDSFLPVQYKPWEITATSLNSNWIDHFFLSKEDGTKYTFSHFNLLKVEGGNYWDDELWAYPYRWHLTEIQYTDGSTTSFDYVQHNNTNSTANARYESSMIDREAVGDAYNLFGINEYGYLNGQVIKAYSSAEKIITDTHYALVYTSRPTADSTERNSRLDSVKIFEAATDQFLRGVKFTYATNSNDAGLWNNPPQGTDPNDPWETNERLNNEQLTLIKVTPFANGIGDLPSYVFAYGNNPKVDVEYLTTHSTTEEFPGYHTDAEFETAWRLAQIKLPTGGTINYAHQGGINVNYDSEGRVKTGSTYWNYKDQPRCRVVSKAITDPIDNLTRTWTYSYSPQVIYDPPSRPIGSMFISSYFQKWDFTDDPNDYQKFFRGCGLTHRWVKTTNPDGTYHTRHFTSSYQGTGADSLESFPDVIWSESQGAPSYLGIIGESNAAKRGVVWKEETGYETSTYEYEFEAEGVFKDVYTYYQSLIPGANQNYIRQYSYFAKLVKKTVTRDGIDLVTLYSYNPTRRQAPEDGNGLISGVVELGSSFNRWTSYEYAHARYQDMDGAYMLSQPYSVTTGRGLIPESVEWTTWGEFQNLWMPRKKWVWNAGPDALYAPADTTEDTLGTVTYVYDNLGYGNVISSKDANGNETKLYYGTPGADPFTSTTVGHLRGYVTGVEKPQAVGGPLLTNVFEYDAFGNPVVLIDENSDTTRLVYDALNRLTDVIAQEWDTVSHFDYSFADWGQNFPNLIHTMDFRSVLDTVQSTIYYDGLGFERQKHQRIGVADIVSATSYDGMRRVDSTYKVYQDTLTVPHSFDPDYALNAEEYYPQAGVSPYSRTEYLTDGSGRVLHSHAPGDLFQDEQQDRYLQYAYSTGFEGTDEGADPDELIQSDPEWTTNQGTILDAVSDGETWDDNDYATTDDEFVSFTVGVGEFVTEPGQSADLKIRFRARRRGGSCTEATGIGIMVWLYHDTTALGSNGASKCTLQLNTFSEFSLVLSTESFEPSDLTLVVKSTGPQETGDIIDISWLRVETVYKEMHAVSVIDENGVEKLELRDDYGNLHQRVSDVGGLDLVTKFRYDGAGRVIRSTNPAGQVSDYISNKRGLMIEKSSPDAGTTRYRYDRVGNLRFEQNADQAVANPERLTYRKYDRLNRLIEEGEVAGDFDMVDSTTTGDPSSDYPTSATFAVKNVYDTDLSGDPSARNLKGKLTASITQHGSSIDSMMYSYDDRGRVEWQLVQLGDLTDRKLIYDYDWQGNPTRIGYLDLELPANDFFLFYEYDEAGRVAITYSGDDSTGIGKVQESSYTYQANNQVKRHILGQAQGMDYLYNERDWLTQINHQNLDPAQDPGNDSPATTGIPVDRFGMVLGYNTLAHIGTAQSATPQYNGNISWSVYNMFDADYAGPGSTTSLVGYSFDYDSAYRITSADFGRYLSSAWDATSAYDVSSYGYDGVGNLTALHRYGHDANSMDDFAYNYYSGSNRLEFIDDPVASGNYDSDIDDQESGNYGYDLRGNMISDASNSASLVYDYRNLPTQITHQSVTTKYEYNAAGQRTFKGSVSSDSSFYIYDLQGRQIAVLDGSGNPRMLNLHANDHIGYIGGVPDDPRRYYYLKDHLGTIRVVVDGSGTVVYELFDKDLSDWVTVKGAGYSLVSEELKNSSTNENLLMSLSTTTMTDGQISVDIKSTSSSYADASVVVRYVDVDNYYLVYPINENLQIIERVNGVNYLRAYASLPSAITAGQWNEIEVFLLGATISAAWNGVGLVSWEDTESPFLDGRFGFRQGWNRDVRWDNLAASWPTINGDVAVVAYDDYYPFGMQMEERSEAGIAEARFKYTGKERDGETGYDYFGARYYDASIGRWLQVDPKATKYADWSSYSFVLDNPLTHVDPDGQEVQLAEGSSKQFQQSVAAAVQYLNEHKASGMLADLHQSETVYYLAEGDFTANYDHNTRTIYWDPTMGVITNLGVEVSPTSVLNHEVDHALRHDKETGVYKADKSTGDVAYDNKEEKRVIEGSEQRTAKKLGEIKEGEVTRRDHGGLRYKTTGPTSTEARDAVIAVPKKDPDQ